MPRAVLGLLACVAACSFVPTGLAEDPSADGGPTPIDGGPPGDDGALPDTPPIAVDARVIDAPPPIDAAPGCVNYVAGYRYIATHQTWREAELDCEDDSTGRSHLAVIDNSIEMIVLQNALVGTEDAMWIGVLRDRSSTTNPQSWQWRHVTGGNAGYLPWATGEPDNATTDGFVVRLGKSAGRYYDRSVEDATLPALCECDNQPAVDANYD